MKCDVCGAEMNGTTYLLTAVRVCSMQCAMEWSSECNGGKTGEA